ncbi:hypothetical protein DPX16_8419 [Anabarilius grahami]|uniref:Reverse transcriptase domain-containing protein n=1 Tax=Anabarilius grahami TaxID=495550 RepID=A0A3N0Z2Z6_ANAGA|nr:hypothetical protein DPX16_8419 [Anabarilius grahami]
MDTITADLQSPHPWSLLFTDDVFLASETRAVTQRDTQLWKDRLDEYGLRLNIKKIEYLEGGPQTDGTISIDNEELKKTEVFRYLGSVISHHGNVAPIKEKMLESRLQWYGHVVRSAEDSVAKTATRIDPVGHRPRGRPKKRWMDRIKEDLKIVNASPEDALDRPKWRRLCQRADPAIAGETPG